jgi:hypothetical protein
LAKPSGSSQSKGNPAHKRMSNERLKVRRARSYARGHGIKLANAAMQRARTTANRDGVLTRKWQARLAALPGETQAVLGMAGPVTPWIIARAERRLRRRPLQEMYAKRHKEDALSAS